VFSSPVGRLRIISLVEGLSFLVLLTCAVLKRTSDFNAVPVMGPIHGALFILYILATLDVGKRLGWSGARTTKVALGAIPPFVPFFIERWLRGQEPTKSQKAPASA
jgi:integral membrane protein